MSEALIGVAVWLLGLCIGSFLNVVIYRLPLGLSVREPTWSFCPHCKTTLAWYDNIPVLGWLLLRGRCRYCAAPISIQYPLIEAITGLLFLLVYYLLFAQHARIGVHTTSWPADAPLLLAWLVLAAALLVISAMDLVSYYIDPVVTNIAVGLGVVLTAAWPRPGFVLPQAESPFGATAAAVFLASAAWLWWTERRYRQQLQAAASNAVREPAEAETPAALADAPAHLAAQTSFAAAVIAILLLVGLALGLLLASCSSGCSGDGATYLVGAIFAVVFAAMVRTGAQPRSADEEIHDEIEEEAPHARRNTLHEILWLCVPVAAGGLAFIGLALSPAAQTGWYAAAHWSPGGDFRPVAGAVFAMHGAMVAATAGWLVRILFTLVFGREAFGLGDIYILAAAGACAGWDIALLGFLLSVGIALLAWIISLFSKRSAMIAFGPPLALGFLLALWWNAPADRIFAELKAAYWPGIRAQPGLFGGLLLVSGVIAVAASRLIRRVVEPGEKPDDR